MASKHNNSVSRQRSLCIFASLPLFPGDDQLRIATSVRLCKRFIALTKEKCKTEYIDESRKYSQRPSTYTLELSIMFLSFVCCSNRSDAQIWYSNQQPKRTARRRVIGSRVAATLNKPIIYFSWSLNRSWLAIEPKSIWAIKMLVCFSVSSTTTPRDNWMKRFDRICTRGEQAIFALRKPTNVCAIDPARHCSRHASERGDRTAGAQLNRGTMSRLITSWLKGFSVRKNAQLKM